MIKLLVLTISILTVASCGANTRTVTKTKEVIVERGAVVCDVLDKPMNRHMRAVIANGDRINNIGGDEVVVTASELSDVYKKSCK